MDLPSSCLNRIQGLLATGQRKMVGIVAPPGAGKSTFTEALEEAFPQSIQAAAMDGFHLANSELVRLGRAQRKGAPDTFDAFGFVNLLQRIKQQSNAETVYVPVFNRELEESIAGSTAIRFDTPLIITEGNYLLLDMEPWARLRTVIDEVWYLDVDEAVRQQRLLQRHMRFGRSRSQALQWMARSDDVNAALITETRQRADLLVRWDETPA